jgi:hypothetical protein
MISLIDANGEAIATSADLSESISRSNHLGLGKEADIGDLLKE